MEQARLQETQEVAKRPQVGATRPIKEAVMDQAVHLILTCMELKMSRSAIVLPRLAIFRQSVGN